MKYSFILGMIPIAIWVLIPSKRVVSETVNVVKTVPVSVDTFKLRWSPLYPPLTDVPETRLVRTIPIRKENESLKEVPVPEPRPDVNPRPKDAPNDPTTIERSERKRGIHKARFVYRDICSRHNMRRVVTNNGRSWRCKRVT